MVIISTIFMVHLFFSYKIIKDDLFYNKIYNKTLAYYFLILFILTMISYIYTRPNLNIFYYLLSIIIPFFFFFFKIWGAGDSKLLTILLIAFPFQFLKENPISTIPKLLNLLFIISFFIFFIDGIRYSIVTKNYNFNKKLIRNRIFQILEFYFVLNILNSYLSIIIKNNIFLLILNIFLSFSLYFLLSKINFRFQIFIVILSIIYTGVMKINFSFGSILICLFIFIFKEIIKKSNYEEVLTQSVENGMILSFKTVELFQKSRVKNLPKFTDESKKTAIEKESVEAIKRWEYSKYGEPKIEIVKKVPFSLYIYISYYIFFVHCIYSNYLKR